MTKWLEQSSKAKLLKQIVDEKRANLNTSRMGKQLKNQKNLSSLYLFM